MMRAIIGNAVIDSEAPRNSAAWLALIDSLKKPPLERSRIARADAERERRQDAGQRHRRRLPACERRSRSPSNSRPTVNM